MTLTFRQFLMEYELVLPETEYGYWVNAQGKFFPVDTQEHASAAEELIPSHFRELYPSDHPYEIAFKVGWVRLYEVTFSSGVTQIGVELTKIKPVTHTAVRYYLTAMKDKYFNKEVNVRITYGKQSTRYDTIRQALVGWAQYNQ